MKDFLNGQPTKKAGKRSRAAKEFYQLGRASASLEQKKRDADQASQLSMVQRLKMFEDRMELMKIAASLQLQQKVMEGQMLDQKVASMMGPPNIGGPPPFQGPPELPPPPPSMPMNGGGPMVPPMPMGPGQPPMGPQYEVAEYGAVPPMY